MSSVEDWDDIRRVIERELDEREAAATPSPNTVTSERAGDIASDLKMEIARCHARLEIDHAFRLEGGELVRFEIPMEERNGFPDGIEARDCTIAEMDRRIAELEHYLKYFRKLAKEHGPADTALATAKREWAAKAMEVE